MKTLTTRFVAILTGLRAVIGTHLARDRSREAVFVLLWTRIGRTANRFAALFARWRAGKLPRPRPSRAGQSRSPRAPQPRLPRKHVWVVAEIGYQAAGYAGQLQHLLAEPDMADFLAAAPQAGRLLRPLCHMLGITAAPELPASLALPPPPRFRPAPPPPPPHRGIENPPEVAPFYQSLPRGRAWSV